MEYDQSVLKQYEDINFTYVNTYLFCDTTKLKEYSSTRWSLSEKVDMPILKLKSCSYCHAVMNLGNND